MTDNMTDAQDLPDTVLDIVERLRDRDAIVMSGLFHAVPTMQEAADEIERLRRSPVRADRDAVLEVLEKLWLWRDGEGRFLAFRSLFPTMPDCGDPAVLGQPCGYAIFHPMTLAEAQAASREHKAEGSNPRSTSVKEI
jgi:hypothetical protein